LGRGAAQGNAGVEKKPRPGRAGLRGYQRHSAEGVVFRTKAIQVAQIGSACQKGKPRRKRGKDFLERKIKMKPANTNSKSRLF
jgi:hypothetical protein